MSKYLLVLVTFLTLSFSQAQEQIKITKPSEGKAVVYFIRTQSAGGAINFKYFDSNHYIGKFSGANFLRYECEPGKRTLWAKAENVDFIDADLKAGEIYFVEARGVMGAFKAGVKLFLVDYTNDKQMKRINKVFDKKEGVVINTEEAKEEFEKKKNSLTKSMRKIQKKRAKKPEKVKKLNLDMSYKE